MNYLKSEYQIILTRETLAVNNFFYNNGNYSQGKFNAKSDEEIFLAYSSHSNT